MSARGLALGSSIGTFAHCVAVSARSSELNQGTLDLKVSRVYQNPRRIEPSPHMSEVIDWLRFRKAEALLFTEAEDEAIGQAAVGQGSVNSMEQAMTPQP